MSTSADVFAPDRPVRTCVGCRRRDAKAELLRVTAGSGPGGEPAVVPDPTGTAPGRGAYLHPTTDCRDLAVRRRAFGRALRVTGSGARGLSVALLDHLPEPTPQHHLTETDHLGTGALRS